MALFGFVQKVKFSKHIIGLRIIMERQMLLIRGSYGHLLTRYARCYMARMQHEVGDLLLRDPARNVRSAVFMVTQLVTLVTIACNLNVNKFALINSCNLRVGS